MGVDPVPDRGTARTTRREGTLVSMPQAGYATPIAHAPAETRAAYMRRVYTNLMLGVVAFVAMEVALFSSGLAESIFWFVMDTNWLPILGGFMLVSWLGSRLTTRAQTPAAAWGGYLVIVAANALIFAAPLFLANEYVPGAISNAALITLVAFAGLSGIAITTGKDFSFLRGILMWGGLIALIGIVAAALTGFELGTWFIVAMIAFAGAAILYDTQKIFRSFPPGTEVVAASHLFSSLALMFWYVLQLLLRR
ncbi:permease [Nitriliruptoraceae bacterium ZYF776]|nr:permease [Profundirhabdus halotolerans]